MTIPKERARPPVSGRRWIRSLCAVATVAAVAGAEITGVSARPPGASSAKGAATQVRPLWLGQRWIIRGSAIERGSGWIAIDDAVASTPGPEPAWNLRADRLVAWVDGPHRIGGFRARGRVRVVGPEPFYIAGARACTFRPGRSLTVAGTASGAELLDTAWRLTGRRVDVDLRRRSATVLELGPGTRL